MQSCFQISFKPNKHKQIELGDMIKRAFLFAIVQKIQNKRLFCNFTLAE